MELHRRGGWVMGILGDSVAAAIFTDRATADEAWGALADAGIASTVVTDPGILGSFSIEIVVHRDDLDEAQRVLAPIVRRSL
jgi:hypothetical protein